MKHTLISDWREKLVFSQGGPEPQILISTDKLKSVLVGLEAGQKIPPHPAPAAVYHFLDGSGWILVNEERIRVQRGATIVVPENVTRGVEAESRLSFLGTHSGEHK